MKKTTIGVRDVDEEIFRKFRAVSIAHKKRVGDALSLAMNQWIHEQEQQEKPDIKNLVTLTGIINPKKKVKWSEEVDTILYGDDDTS